MTLKINFWSVALQRMLINLNEKGGWANLCVMYSNEPKQVVVNFTFLHCAFSNVFSNCFEDAYSMMYSNEPKHVVINPGFIKTTRIILCLMIIENFQCIANSGIYNPNLNMNRACYSRSRIYSNNRHNLYSKASRVDNVIVFKFISMAIVFPGHIQ